MRLIGLRLISVQASRRFGALLLLAFVLTTNRACNCSRPLPIDNGTSLNITGPVALQGMGMESPWCTAFPEVSSVFPRPCPDEFANASIPHWVSGSGFSIVDGNSSNVPIPRIYTQQSQVQFQVPVSFTDDTSAVAVSYPECTMSFFPGALEGNSGTFILTVQAWNPNATTCMPPITSQNPDYPDVPNDTSPLPGQKGGCWEDLGSTSTQLYGSSFGPPSAANVNLIAQQDKAVSSLLVVGVNLKQPSTYVRYVITLQEGDSRVIGSETESGWGPSVHSPDSNACKQLSDMPGFQAVCPASSLGISGAQPNDMFTWFPFCPDDAALHVPPASGMRVDQYMWLIHHAAAGSLWYSRALTPFQVIVNPMALVQTKVLPYTLVYMPPGNSSKATYATTTSFGISMVADDKLSMNQSATIDNKETDTPGVSVS
ncbi:MAG TPA: hypothetical protein VJ891_03645, partial [Casimicrobiaceae bacterium]|nr:hypothetical protein [Casimicrobiaceae bacterium]